MLQLNGPTLQISNLRFGHTKPVLGLLDSTVKLLDSAVSPVDLTPKLGIGLPQRLNIVVEVLVDLVNAVDHGVHLLHLLFLVLAQLIDGLLGRFDLKHG